MKLMNEERIILESDSKEMLLTTHRIRYSTKRWGTARVTSILLEELDSCEIRSISNPILLILAAFSVLAGFYFNDDAILYGIIVGFLLVAFYFLTRLKVISLKSSSSTINLRTTGMKIETATAFVDSVESAKNSRYLRFGATH